MKKTYVEQMAKISGEEYRQILKMAREMLKGDR